MAKPKAKAPRAAAAKAPTNDGNLKPAKGWQDMSLSEFDAALAHVRALTEKYAGDVLAALGATPTLTDDDRRHAPKLREAQYDGYFASLDVAEMRPELFKYLADKDQGKDPSRFETDLLRERLTKHRGFTDLAGAIAPVATLFSDAPLAIATQIGEPCSATYQLAKGLANVDPEVRSKMANALSAASRIGKAAAKTRAANKKKNEK